MTGHINSISASGNLWVGHDTGKISNTVFDLMLKAKTSIQISAFSLGGKNEATQTFFNILREQLNADRYVQFIVNDFNGDTIGKFSKEQINSLKQFQNFDFFDFSGYGKYGTLHAKIIVVDRSTALIGSPNISDNAMTYNYEIMLNIGGDDVAKIANLLDSLTIAIKHGDVL